MRDNAVPGLGTAAFTRQGSGASLSVGSPGYCVICRQDTGKVEWVASDHRALSCGCGVVYMDPLPAPGVVDLTTEKHSEGYYSYSAHARLRWVQHFQPKGKVLEVGCGGGYFLAAARDAGYEVSGVDPDSDAARFVQDTYGIDVEKAFIEESLLPEEGFDVVFHVDLLSHFPDPVRAIEAMKRRLKPGGYLCFEVGGQGLGATRYYASKGTAGYPYHLWLYEERGVRSLLEKQGLEVVRIKRFGLLAGVLLLMLGQFAQQLLKGANTGNQTGHRAFGSVTRLRSAWDRLQHICRYVIGPWMPPIGPQTLWVTARRPVLKGVTSNG